MSWAGWSNEVKWLEISFLVEGELAEPIAELLARVAANGVAIDEAPEVEGRQDRDRAVVVRGWLPQDSQLASRKRTLEQGLWHLGQIHPLPDPIYRQIAQSNWSDAWQDLHRPIPVGRKFMVTPPWLNEAQGARILLRIEPGMAFGTGTHPTTQHCLEALEATVRPNDTVVDLGCGSGILGIAAAKLGAKRIIALDTDPHAVEATQENAARNRVYDRFQVLEGSLEELKRLHGRSEAEVQVLVANILASTLEAMIDNGLADVIEPEGTVVLSGLLADQLGSILTHAEMAGLEVVEVKQAGDWRTPILKRKPPLN